MSVELRVTIDGGSVLVQTEWFDLRLDEQQATELASELQAAVLVLLRRAEAQRRLRELREAAQRVGLGGES